jgi:hypothetical protein
MSLKVDSRTDVGRAAALQACLKNGLPDLAQRSVRVPTYLRRSAIKFFLTLNCSLTTIQIKRKCDSKKKRGVNQKLRVFPESLSVRMLTEPEIRCFHDESGPGASMRAASRSTAGQLALSRAASGGGKNQKRRQPLRFNPLIS